MNWKRPSVATGTEFPGANPDRLRRGRTRQRVAQRQTLATTPSDAPPRPIWATPVLIEGTCDLRRHKSLDTPSRPSWTTRIHLTGGLPMSESIRVVCPNCQATYRLPPTAIGKSAACKQCNGKFTVKVAPQELPAAELPQPESPPASVVVPMRFADEHPPKVTYLPRSSRVGSTSPRTPAGRRGPNHAPSGRAVRQRLPHHVRLPVRRRRLRRPVRSLCVRRRANSTWVSAPPALAGRRRNDLLASSKPNNWPRTTQLPLMLRLRASHTQTRS